MLADTRGNDKEAPNAAIPVGITTPDKSSP